MDLKVLVSHNFWINLKPVLKKYVSICSILGTGTNTVDTKTDDKYKYKNRPTDSWNKIIIRVQKYKKTDCLRDENKELFDLWLSGYL